MPWKTPRVYTCKECGKEEEAWTNGVRLRDELCKKCDNRIRMRKYYEINKEEIRKKTNDRLRSDPEYKEKINKRSNEAYRKKREGIPKKCISYICGVCGKEESVPRDCKKYRELLCKSCYGEKFRKLKYANNREVFIEKTRKYREENPEKVKEQSRRSIEKRDKEEHLKKRKDKYRLGMSNADYVKRKREHARKWYIEHAEKVLLENKKWAINNREKSNENKKKYMQMKRRTDPMYRIRMSVSGDIRWSLRNGKNGKKWESLVGYSLSDLTKHLESRFKPGMTWENYGKKGWHIDHIKPLSHYSFDSYEDEQFRQAWSLDNLQPLWAHENLAKGNRWVG